MRVESPLMIFLFRRVGNALISAKQSEAVSQRYSVKNMSLEISQNSQKNTCVRDPFQ